MMILASCCFQDLLFISVFWIFDYNVSCICFLSSSYFEYGEFLVCLHACLSSNLGPFQTSFLHTLTLSHCSSGTPTMTIVGPLDGVPEAHYGLFFFLQSFSFLFLRLDNFHCPIFKFTDSFFWPAQICLWIPLMNFSFKLLYLFISRISFWFLFRHSVSLLIIFNFVHTLFSWISPHLLLVLWASLGKLFNVFV